MTEEAGTAPCVFCAIVAGTLPASVVYEDDATLAFMDLRQPGAGHVLVVPKQHVAAIYDLSADVAARLMQTTVLIARALRDALRPAGVNLWQSNGEAAGQEVFHVHLHVLGREPGDGLFRIYPQQPLMPESAALDALAAQIRQGLNLAGE